MSSPPAGASLVNAPAPEERRLVTVLFCDLVGYTALSEKLDVEEVREVQNAYLAAMSAEIHRFGGMVEKYAGDAILAIFGAPIAHEDDPERAVRCALRMRQSLAPLSAEALTRWGIRLAVRIGINTGEVISGLRTVDGRADYAVTGDAVNTAARLQTAAPENGILAGEETMHLSRRAVLFGPQQALTLKGKAGLVAAYPVLGLRDQLAERWEIAERRSPLVGRDRELAALLDAWQEVRSGAGRLLSVVAEAGVGKSRLVAEATEHMGAGESRILRGRCLSHTEGVSLALLADVVRNVLRTGSRPDELRRGLSDAVTAVLPSEDAETQRAAIDVLGEVLGLPPGGSVVTNADAKIRRQVLIRSLHLLFAALTRTGPLVMVLEDLHWVDSGSLDVLLEVLAGIHGLPVLVVATHRPEWSAAWESWDWVQRLELHPLAATTVSKLARSILSGAALSEKLEAYLVERCGGNPYFVEELLRTLQEVNGLTERDGQVELVPGSVDRLPATLTELLLARLDRLEPEVRSLVQVGSVIGVRFPVRVLALITAKTDGDLQGPLEALERSALAFPRWTPELEYAFKHSVIQEVAYNTLLTRRRRQLHLQTARALIALYPAEEYVEVIAYHYARTDKHEDAAEWMERAGDRAAAVYDNDTALRDYEEAGKRLELSGAHPMRVAHLNEKLGAVLARVGQYDRALAVIDAGIDLLKQVGDPGAADTLTALAGRVHTLRGTPREGRARIEQFLATLGPAHPPRGVVALHSALARCCLFSGAYAEGAEAAGRAAELARAIEDERLLAQVELERGALCYALGNPLEARHVLEGALLLAESAEDLETVSRVLMNLSGVHLGLGDFAGTREYVERAARIYERLGDPGAIGNLYLAEVLIRMGEWAEAWGYVERGAEIVRSLGTSVLVADPPLSRGQLYLYEGRWEDARRELEEAVALARSIGHRNVEERGHWLLAELDLMEGRPEAALARLEPLLGRDVAIEVGVLSTLGQAHLTLGDVHHAEMLAAQALQVAEERHHRRFLVHVLRLRGMIETHRERWDTADRAFAEAVSVAHTMPDPYAAARALAEWGAMHLQMGEKTAGRAQLGEALKEMERLGARKDAAALAQELAALN